MLPAHWWSRAWKGRGGRNTASSHSRISHLSAYGGTVEKPSVGTLSPSPWQQSSTLRRVFCMHADCSWPKGEWDESGNPAARSTGGWDPLHPLLYGFYEDTKKFPLESSRCWSVPWHNVFISPRSQMHGEDLIALLKSGHLFCSLLRRIANYL